MAEEKKEEQLSTKKKRAMLEYMGIMFAAAFLLVAISLFAKLNSVQHDLDAANSGALENITQMEQRLSNAESEQEKLERSAKAAELLLLAQNAYMQKDTVSFHGYMAELEGYADVLPDTASEIYTELVQKLS